MSQSSSRIPLVGVIGGDDPTGVARLLGRELTRRACAVLTGGSARSGGTATKNATLAGTVDAEQDGQGIARSIGVLPNSFHGKFAFEYVTRNQLLIHAGGSSMDRNPINGTTPDILICFPGGPGTICELVFGLAAGRQAIFYGQAATILLDQCRARDCRREISRIFHDWHSHLKLSVKNDAAMIDLLVEYLRAATSRPILSTASELVDSLFQTLPKELPMIPAFPGLPGQDHQKQIKEFQTWWNQLDVSSTANENDRVEPH